MTSKKEVPELGPLEYAVVQILWRIGQSTAREVQERYNRENDKPLAYTTVMTLLTRMAEKGVLDVERSRAPFEFSPRITSDQLIRQRVKDFVDVFFEGRAVDLAVRLVEDTPLSQESLEKLERILRKHKPSDEPSQEEEGQS